MCTDGEIAKIFNYVHFLDIIWISSFKVWKGSLYGDDEKGMIRVSTTVVGLGFPRWLAPSQPIILAIFPENYMKMNEI